MKTIEKHLIEEKKVNLSKLNLKPVEREQKSFIENIDDDFFREDFKEYSKNFIEERLNKKYKIVGIIDLKQYYSFSYSQGDGFMFEAYIPFKNGLECKIKQYGHYYHYNSKIIEFFDYSEKKTEKFISKFEENFNSFYVDLCQELAKIGYEFLENLEKEEEQKSLLSRFFSQKNIQYEYELFDINYSDKKSKKMPVEVCKDFLYIEDLELNYKKERILKAHTFINEEITY